MELIQSLLSFGWELNHYGEVVYPPVGDDDSFSWKSVPVDQKVQVMAELKKKQDCNELRSFWHLLGKRNLMLTNFVIGGLIPGCHLYVSC